MATHHHHHHHANNSQSLLIALSLTLGFAGIEAVAGWWFDSLALMSDAGHMVSDSTALAIAALAAWLIRRPPSAMHSYGLVRAEIVAALVNSLVMVAVVVIIVIAAIRRLQDPVPVHSAGVMAVALIGLIINIAVAWILSRGEQTINIRAAMLHVMGDLLGSAAALVAGLVIYFTGWSPIDPLLSLLICLLILASAVRLLRDGLHIVMEGVPRHIDLPAVGRAMAAVKGVGDVHDLHIWTLSSGNIALSAHVVIPDMSQWPYILKTLRSLLHDEFAIEHSTLQPEPSVTHIVQRMPYRPSKKA